MSEQESAHSLFRLDGKVIILTGACGQLGRAYTKALLECGAKVVALDVYTNNEAVEFLDTNICINNDSEPLSYFQIDVCDRSRLEEVCSHVLTRFGRIDGLVNNAAIDAPPNAPASETGPFETYPETSFDRIMNVNVKGVLLCCQVFGKAMSDAGKGSIVNIGSIYGELSPNQSIYDFRRENGEEFFKPVAYSVSKSALYNLTRYIGTYWAKSGVRTNILTLSGLFNNQPKGFIDAYLPLVPMGRMAEEKDYVGPLVFLLSDASRYMTGSTMTVDGGWKAW